MQRNDLYILLRSYRQSVVEADSLITMYSAFVRQLRKKTRMAGIRIDALLQAIEARAIAAGINKLVVLTTRTAHWFRERGFVAGDKADLPGRKKSLYNYQRNSKVFYKLL